MRCWDRVKSLEFGPSHLQSQFVNKLNRERCELARDFVTAQVGVEQVLCRWYLCTL